MMGEATVEIAGRLFTPRALTDSERDALKAAVLARGYKATSVLGPAALVIERRRSTDIDALLSQEAEQ